MSSNLFRNIKTGFGCLSKLTSLILNEPDIVNAHIAEIERTIKSTNVFKKNEAGQDGSSGLLRRNTHRLEKALCFPIKKEFFAEKFITETVVAYLKLRKNPSSDEREITWANQVLTRYFKEVGKGNKTIENARSHYLTAGTSCADTCKTPYMYSSLSPSPVSIDGLEALCRQRVSCRWFLDEEIDVTSLHKAIDVAAQAASACNRQPFVFLQIKDANLRKKIVSIPYGTKGYGDDLPNLLVVVGDLSCIEKPRDRHLIYIDSSLATSQLLLAFTAQNLGSVPINWPDVEANHIKARKLLGLHDHHVPIMLVGFGKPKKEAMIPYSEKKDHKRLLKTYDEK